MFTCSACDTPILPTAGIFCPKCEREFCGIDSAISTPVYPFAVRYCEDGATWEEDRASWQSACQLAVAVRGSIRDARNGRQIIAHIGAVVYADAMDRSEIEYFTV